MTLQNAAAGKTYEVILETAGVRWQAIWRTVDKDGTPMRGPHGSTVDHDGEALQARVLEMLLIEDPALAGAQWNVEPPLPPWLASQ